jgi:hypothetical protein
VIICEATTDSNVRTRKATTLELGITKYLLAYKNAKQSGR